MVVLLVTGGIGFGCLGVLSAQIAEPVRETELTPEPEKTDELASPSAPPDHLWLDFAGPEGLGELCLRAEDPCLPPQFANWRERWLVESRVNGDRGLVQARVIIDRSTFRLFLQGIRRDLSVVDIYSTPVAIGHFETPTPVGQFLINHIYCYEDVLFYDVNERAVPGLYNGFFAPLLVCDEQGHCQRHLDLGIHGFDAASYPDPNAIAPQTQGPVSHGCIRLPDPCAFKTALIEAVGIEPLKRNERGSYHWLKKPVEVWVVDDEATLLSLMEEGLSHMGRGLRGIFNWIWD